THITHTLHTHTHTHTTHTHITHTHTHTHTYIYRKQDTSTHTHTHTHIYIENTSHQYLYTNAHLHRRPATSAHTQIQTVCNVFIIHKTFSDRPIQRPLPCRLQQQCREASSHNTITSEKHTHSTPKLPVLTHTFTESFTRLAAVARNACSNSGVS